MDGNYMEGFESLVCHTYPDLRIFLSRMVQKMHSPAGERCSAPEASKEGKAGSFREAGMKKAPFLPQCGKDGACQVHHPVVPMLHAVAWE
ncbi:hypothetical protein CXU13_06075 [Akkermansia muciniphila]|nr:hypothetical protein [Akkermansia muciniphila]HCL33039.1 hypothetical protein [Akkermansia sp.]PNC21936.1 hypothetical protein CXU18_02525 [Akkermansia muciniphila]PNC24949.1 hypothetical protein CXU19_03350 [Akkermansia muciniphila]PNC30750.1 hypothetical protein CXU17_04180 [Akkermansia muciniphila]